MTLGHSSGSFAASLRGFKPGTTPLLRQLLVLWGHFGLKGPTTDIIILLLSLFITTHIITIITNILTTIVAIIIIFATVALVGGQREDSGKEVMNRQSNHLCWKGHMRFIEEHIARLVHHFVARIFFVSRYFPDFPGAVDQFCMCPQ